VYGAAQLFGLGRGSERARVVTGLGMHIAVAGMKPLKILVGRLDQLRSYLVLTVIHVFTSRNSC
jgi:hypothetical protein